MALNFTGRTPPAAAVRPSRTPIVAAAILGVAALLAGAVFLAALQQHRAQAPQPLPPLTGADKPLAAAAPEAPASAKPAAPAEPAWILHRAAAPPAAPEAPTSSPAKPSAQDSAAAKARMLAALRQVPHGVVTLSVEDDPVAEAYAERLSSLFREAGWTVERTSVFGSGPPRRGLAAAFGVSPADEAVREAFDAIGFQFLAPPRDSITRTPEIFIGTP